MSMMPELLLGAAPPAVTKARQQVAHAPSSALTLNKVATVVISTTANTNTNTTAG